MSDQGNEKADCPFSGHGEELVNIKFFRGTRNDVIAGAEIMEQFRSAVMQRRSQIASVSMAAPASQHPSIDVRDFVASL